MNAITWTFEISRSEDRRKYRSHPSRPWAGDYGSGRATAPTEDEARAIVARSIERWGMACNGRPHVAGDLLEVKVGEAVVWSNFGRREDPYLPAPAKRSAIAAKAVAAALRTSG